MKHKKEHIVLFLLVIFYSVGTFGLISAEYRDLFLSLTPFNLMLTGGLLIWSNNQFNYKTLIQLVVIFLIGFTFEFVGVNTGLLFGEYSYGNSLGIKLGGVPLVIGVNWIMLSLSSASFCRLLFSDNKKIIIFSAVFMTCLDILIEPVAVKLDFWHWKYGIIPLQNYFMWFLTSLFIQYFISRFKMKLNIAAGSFVFFIQFIFFALLNLFLK